MRSFAGIMGIIFIVIGVVGSIGILLSFDWSTWNHVKELPLTQADTIAVLKVQRTDTFIMSAVTLIGNLAVGSLLLAMDKIIQLLTKYNRTSDNLRDN